MFKDINDNKLHKPEALSGGGGVAINGAIDFTRAFTKQQDRSKDGANTDVQAKFVPGVQAAAVEEAKPNESAAEQAGDIEAKKNEPRKSNTGQLPFKVSAREGAITTELPNVSIKLESYYVPQPLNTNLTTTNNGGVGNSSNDGNVGDDNGGGNDGNDDLSYKIKAGKYGCGNPLVRLLSYLIWVIGPEQNKIMNNGLLSNLKELQSRTIIMNTQISITNSESNDIKDEIKKAGVSSMIFGSASLASAVGGGAMQIRSSYAQQELAKDQLHPIKQDTYKAKTDIEDFTNISDKLKNTNITRTTLNDRVKSLGGRHEAAVNKANAEADAMNKVVTAQERLGRRDVLETFDKNNVTSRADIWVKDSDAVAKNAAQGIESRGNSFSGGESYNVVQQRDPNTGNLIGPPVGRILTTPQTAVPEFNINGTLNTGVLKRVTSDQEVVDSIAQNANFRKLDQAQFKRMLSRAETPTSGRIQDSAIAQHADRDGNIQILAEFEDTNGAKKMSMLQADEDGNCYRITRAAEGEKMSRYKMEKLGKSPELAAIIKERQNNTTHMLDLTVTNKGAYDRFFHTDVASQRNNSQQIIDEHQDFENIAENWNKGAEALMDKTYKRYELKIKGVSKADIDKKYPLNNQAEAALDEIVDRDILPQKHANQTDVEYVQTLKDHKSANGPADLAEIQHHSFMQSKPKILENARNDEIYEIDNATGRINGLRPQADFELLKPQLSKGIPQARQDLLACPNLTKEQINGHAVKLNEAMTKVDGLRDFNKVRLDQVGSANAKTGEVEGSVSGHINNLKQELRVKSDRLNIYGSVITNGVSTFLRTVGEFLSQRHQSVSSYKEKMLNVTSSMFSTQGQDAQQQQRSLSSAVSEISQSAAQTLSSVRSGQEIAARSK